MKLSTFLTIFALICITKTIFSKKTKKDSSNDQECEVCIDVLNQIKKIANEKEKITQSVAADAIRSFCKNVKEPKQTRLCYYLGAHQDSATSIINDVALPLSYGKDIPKICSELRDSAICALKYDKPIDWSTINLNKMNVKQLNNLLSKLGGKCVGCADKSDIKEEILKIIPPEAKEAMEKNKKEL